MGEDNEILEKNSNNWHFIRRFFVVFCGLFPVDSSEYQKLKDGLAKLQLNDSSFSFEAESSSALGLGFRCGFLGLLHLEIITQRLEREFDINLLTTTPGVVYKVLLNSGKIINLHNPVIIVAYKSYI